ncbi:Methylcobalamin methyltransferase [Lachnospiraceae bacterium TWA4]|nr:Methylcobalamin methyltransferase [Lachnospiraceae bacterium TWA4]
MAIKDFKCTYENSVGVNKELTSGMDVSFPDAYLHRETMVKLSLAVKQYDHAGFCVLPFCCTLEAEAMGGQINMGNENIGPRAKDYVCSSVEELLKLPAIDFTKGRIHETLMAAKQLTDAGEYVVYEVTGPFTVLNGLIDPKYVFKGMRKQPELMEKVFKHLGEQLIEYIKQIKACGVQFISYADSSGGLNILGPKVMEQVTKTFTYDFLKEVYKLADDKTMILLCPKTTYALIGTEVAKFVEHELEQPDRYGESCIQMLGKVKMAGQMCIKNIEYRLESGRFKEVLLKDEV